MILISKACLSNRTNFFPILSDDKGELFQTNGGTSD